MEAAQLQPGDILAFYGSDLASRTISLFTASLRRPSRLRFGPSHVGLVVEHPSRGLLLVESTSLATHPCLFRGHVVKGVQAHYPETRIQDYYAENGRVEVWRMNSYWGLDINEKWDLWDLMKRHFLDHEINYDLRGAITSGTHVLCKILSFLETDLERVFCSELIAATLMRMGRFPLTNATRWNPGRLLRALVSLNVYYFAGPAECNFQVVRHED